MKIQNDAYTLLLSDETGAIEGFSCGERELAAKGARPLFTLKFLTPEGDALYRDPSAFEKPEIRKEDDKVFLTYKSSDLTVCVTLRCPEDCPDTFWGIQVENATGCLLESADFPGLAVKDELPAAGGDALLFWPGMEGFLVEDSTARQREGNAAYREVGGQSGGYGGLYPGPTPLQFMAYYTPEGGLYFAAHDREANLKTLEYYPIEASRAIGLECRVFAEGAAERWALPYEMVLGAFSGDWQDAAAHYRDWMERAPGALPPKIFENPGLPGWMEDSPVVVLYPIKGTKDTGDMTPNCYYPFTNILPYIDSLSQETQSRLMALPMHWEGTAPWAPPYVWPPFGGEEGFKALADGLHERGHLLGVYCSGIGWTTYSFLNPSYDPSDRYDPALICRDPKGEIHQSGVLGAPIRYGYDMCPQSQKVADIVEGEVVKLAEAGCDYAQFFDQNLGGNSCLCYAKDHGHPPAPGKWQADAMKRIIGQAKDGIRRAGSQMLLGCEGAAAEPFIGGLSFNDLRYEIGLNFARPVPAYSFVFHEYINNFMGNQNGVDRNLDMLENPDNFLFRLGYSFTVGDLFTLVLQGDGVISWAWTVPWELTPPDQEIIKTFVGRLNRWRREEGKPYLHTGRMEKPLAFETDGSFTLNRKDESRLTWPALLSSRWRAPDGSQAQFFVNFTHSPHTVRRFKPDGEGWELLEAPGACAKPLPERFTVPPLSAVMVRKA